MSATVLACDINDSNSCAAQGCTACGTGYGPSGRKRRSAERGEVSDGKIQIFKNNPVDYSFFVAIKSNSEGCIEKLNLLDLSRDDHRL